MDNFIEKGKKYEDNMKILYTIDELAYADHIAVAYLSGVSKAMGHESHFCSIDRMNLSDKVREVRPDIIAYSFHNSGFDDIVASHSEAKKHHSFISIAGGPDPSFSPERFNESGMDAYCVGEGEGPWQDFLTAVDRGEPYHDIPNLITEKGVNPVRTLVGELDELPMPDRDLIIANSYLRNASKKTFYLTRGCPFKCTYCYNSMFHNLYKGKGKFVRRFSVDRVIAEMKDVKSKYKMDFVRIGDDLFAIKVDDWLEEFAEKYSKEIGVPFSCYLRLDLVGDRLLKALKKAGCYSVKLSLDSVNEHVRNNVIKRGAGKGRDLQMLTENVRKFHEYGINTWVNYMLTVPETSLQDDIDTIHFSKRAKVTLPHYSTLVPTKGTEIYDYCVEKRLFDPKNHNDDMSGVSEPSTLNCFSERRKRISYNIYLLGPFISKWPWFFYRLGILIIKWVPPNRLFLWIRNTFFEYYNEHKIFKLDPTEDSDAKPVRDYQKGNQEERAPSKRVHTEHSDSAVWS